MTISEPVAKKSKTSTQKSNGELLIQIKDETALKNLASPTIYSCIFDYKSTMRLPNNIQITVTKIYIHLHVLYEQEYVVSLLVYFV